MFVKFFDIAGHKAIVTGGSKGCGYSIVEGFLQVGCEVVILDKDPNTLDVVDEFAENGFNCHGLCVDLAKSTAINNAFEKSLAMLNGQIDILVNNAAIATHIKADEDTPENIRLVFNVNFIAPYLLTAYATRVMKKNKRGRIINITSNLSVFGGKCMAAYSAAKGALLQMTKSFSNDCSRYGITYNAISPGFIDTDMFKPIKNDPVRLEKTVSRIPIGHVGTPDDLKGICIFLASDEASYITGAMLPIDGGYLSLS
jgi:2-deoxy-D-gluconate 3-dehydrogenase